MEHQVAIESLSLGALENNVYVLGSATEVIMIDAGHDAQEISRAIGDRQLTSILLTHGHFDHINAAADVTAMFPSATVYLHPDDEWLWHTQHPSWQLDAYISDQQEFPVGDTFVRALHTPGHTPGSVSFYAPQLQVLFSGDTLFPGGPGATRWEYSDFEQIITSIEHTLFTLPAETRIFPGHGPETTIYSEQPQLEVWKRRGW